MSQESQVTSRKIKVVSLEICVLSLVIAVFVALIGRCFWLQYIKCDYFNSISQKQRLKWILESPQRGTILDCTGRVLAASNKIQTIFAEPRIIKDLDQTVAELAPVVGMEAIELYKLLQRGSNPGFVKIVVDAPAEQCEAAAQIYGIGVQTGWQRYYPVGSLVSHIVGFTGVDNTGLEGIELEYDEKLSGEQGRNVVFADVLRRPVKLKEQSSYVVDGCGVILTINAAIQQFARAEVAKVLDDFQAESAVAIVADPKTGAILAMVSLPDFDPEDLRSANADNMRNRAIADQYEPGSIFKPVAAAIALDAGLVSTTEEIFCENGDWRGKGFGRIGEYGSHTFGNLTIRGILANSSNIGMAKIGQRIGAVKLYKGLKLFGFGEKTGIDLPGEVEGFLRPADKWTGYSVTRIPFGQEISTTAVQIVQAFSILANGGHFVRPFLVKAVVDSDGNIVKLKRPLPPIGFVVKPETARWIVSEALTAVVNEGTGTKAKLEKWQVFGKTGTAQLASPDGKGYSETDYVASFIGGAPVDNPAILVLVSVCKPNIKKAYTGGTVAAPAVAAIIEKTLNYLENR
jgi:cell division protein FtsI (penicillin-binding protein 3)